MKTKFSNSNRNVHAVERALSLLQAVAQNSEGSNAALAV